MRSATAAPTSEVLAFPFMSGVCGPSRMSFYTGRYVNSHGATWNRVPLSAAEHTLGDYLRAAGRVAALAGKTHVLPDDGALARFGIEIESERGALLREGGFVALDRYDGHLPPGPESGYADYLRAHGYTGADPWSDFVIAMEERGQVVSGWHMRNVEGVQSTLALTDFMNRNDKWMVEVGGRFRFATKAL